MVKILAFLAMLVSPSFAMGNDLTCDGVSITLESGRTIYAKQISARRYQVQVIMSGFVDETEFSGSMELSKLEHRCAFQLVDDVSAPSTIITLTPGGQDLLVKINDEVIKSPYNQLHCSVTRTLINDLPSCENK